MHVKRKCSGFQFGNHFVVLLRQPLVELVAQGLPRLQLRCKILVAGAALVNHAAGFIYHRIEKWMRRAAILGLDVIQGLPDAHI